MVRFDRGQGSPAYSPNRRPFLLRPTQRPGHSLNDGRYQEGGRLLRIRGNTPESLLASVQTIGASQEDDEARRSHFELDPLPCSPNSALSFQANQPHCIADQAPCLASRAFAAHGPVQGPVVLLENPDSGDPTYLWPSSVGLPNLCWPACLQSLLGDIGPHRRAPPTPALTALTRRPNGSAPHCRPARSCPGPRPHGPDPRLIAGMPRRPPC